MLNAHNQKHLNNIVDYFTKHNNDVFLASLDATKALDQVTHVTLVNKLTDKSFPDKLHCESIKTAPFFQVLFR